MKFWIKFLFTFIFYQYLKEQIKPGEIIGDFLQATVSACWWGSGAWVGRQRRWLKGSGRVWKEAVGTHQTRVAAHSHELLAAGAAHGRRPGVDRRRRVLRHACHSRAAVPGLRAQAHPQFRLHRPLHQLLAGWYPKLTQFYAIFHLTIADNLIASLYLVSF